ncbi:MAG: GGDEF domain-containing protein [Gammaproteobacteria bacterium]|nr:GGDEF domain-containing protein [Gammaproteobacteria bacterium]
MEDKSAPLLKETLFEDDSIDKASEYLRLALAQLTKFKAAATPVNYSLLYEYVAGRDSKLVDNLDAILAKGETLNPDRAQDLYIQTFYNEYLADERLREGLLSTVAQVIGAVIDIAGKTKLSNSKLELHIGKLAKSSDAGDTLRAVSDILNDTREFVTESKELESDLLSSVEDINRLKKELNDARHEATVDSLTQLNNRRCFDEEINKLIANHDVNDGDFCLVMTDIDHFKKVNDEHGHLVGDKVLSSFARILKSKVRGSDFCARFGGEEFVILLPKTMMANAFSVSENIRTTIENYRLKLKRSGLLLGTITASFGVACHRKNEPVDDFIERCDKALYRAKRLGRNRTVIAD